MGRSRSHPFFTISCFNNCHLLLNITSIDERPCERWRSSTVYDCQGLVLYTFYGIIMWSSCETGRAIAARSLPSLSSSVERCERIRYSSPLFQSISAKSLIASGCSIYWEATYNEVIACLDSHSACCIGVISALWNDVQQLALRRSSASFAVAIWIDAKLKMFHFVLCPYK